ncbi:MAG: hypothetical protein IJC64_04260 [Clostridia bacterium]|nr:hypothetical protein [Clostridia bacterium]
MSTKLICQVFECGNGSFGLSFVVGDLVLREYRYVSRDREMLVRFAQAVNRQDLSPIHIEDVIEDLLA